MLYKKGIEIAILAVLSIFMQINQFYIVPSENLDTKTDMLDTEINIDEDFESFNNESQTGEIPIIKPTKISTLTKEEIELSTNIRDLDFYSYNFSSESEEEIKKALNITSEEYKIADRFIEEIGFPYLNYDTRCAPYYNYSATSTLNLVGYDYSVSNLENFDYNQVWVEGANGYGIGEKITLNCMDYGVTAGPSGCGFVFDTDIMAYRLATKEEYMYILEEERSGNYNPYYFSEFIDYDKLKEGLSDDELYEIYLKDDWRNNAITSYGTYPEGYQGFFDGICIINGYAKNEELFKANSRVKKLKLTIDNDVTYIIELEDTYNLQLIDISYSQKPSFEIIKPIELTFEILEVYPGEKYEDTVLTTIYPSIYSTLTHAN